MAETREQLLYRAKLAEQVEMYHDMADAMKKGVILKAALTGEERKLFSAAYSNVVGVLRNAWQAITIIEQKTIDDMETRQIKDYNLQIEKRLSASCSEVLEILNQYLIPCAQEGDVEGKVFYYTMKGDYYRYLVEISQGDDKNRHTDLAHEAYNQAVKFSLELPSTHPTRLGVALSLSVFYYEITAQPDKALDVAKKAFDDAISELNELQEDSYKESTVLMQKLRDNLTLWTADEEDQA